MFVVDRILRLLIRGQLDDCTGSTRTLYRLLHVILIVGSRRALIMMVVVVDLNNKEPSLFISSANPMGSVVAELCGILCIE